MGKNNIKLKTLLRYPGGKSRALKNILPLIPDDFIEYREPMVGGGSVFFALKEKFPNKKYWINDKNRDLFLFWKSCRDNSSALVKEIKTFKNSFHSKGRGKKLYQYLLDNKDRFTDLQKAARFFILNRITFSGLVESGGYSQESFDLRFTDSSLERIHKASEILQGVRITNRDYSELLTNGGQSVFIFLDPPYISKVKSKLYGKRGELHRNFDHNLFYDNLDRCRQKFIITYDNCQNEGIKEIHKFINNPNWYVREWTLQYGTNFKRKADDKIIEAKKGKELFISNYKLPDVV